MPIQCLAKEGCPLILSKKEKEMKKVITLANLDTSTEQEVVDQVIHHLLTQREKCTNGLTGCLYRNDEGLKCAAGCLIADTEYTPEFDDGFDDSKWDTLVDKGKVPSQHRELISSLQDIHDNSIPEVWEEELRTLCEHRGLNFNFNKGE